jgi:hypothetical protein
MNTVLAVILIVLVVALATVVVSGGIVKVLQVILRTVSR